MSIYLVEKEKKSSKSFFRIMSGRLSKRFVTAGNNSFEGTVENLGMTTITDSNSNISYVVFANYDKKSKTESPMIEVSLHYQGEKIGRQVNIKSVNPKNATMLEMFALCCYADNRGIFKAEETSSFQQIKSYVHQAAKCGRCKEIVDYVEFCSCKLDWDSIVTIIKDIYLDDAAYNQYQECLKLMDMFDYFYEKLE